MNAPIAIRPPINRAAIEATIETLIALLDQIDGDADLEADEDEISEDREPDGASPYLSWGA